MAKRSNYTCQQCGYSQIGWAGKCPDCGTWGSLVEQVETSTKTSSFRTNKTAASTPKKLSDLKSNKLIRSSSKISELDRVLGGGFVPGQVVLIAGEPGIGKSTLLLQVSDSLKNVLYCSGEESMVQIKIRADRLKVKSKQISILEETNIDTLIATVKSLNGKDKPKLVVVDSVQTMFTNDLRGMPGSVGQVREISYRLVRLAKSTQIPIVIVGHVTKEGSVAGPAALAHLVDTVLWFEGDRDLLIRMLRSVKNRFGPTDEIGVFVMENVGLQPADQLDKLFVSQEKTSVPGSVVTVTMEGTRPILAEIQSLVAPSRMAYPKRIAQGLDQRRLEVILAVLTRRCRIPIVDWDVFVNAVGGISIREPAADLAIALSLASAFKNKKLPTNFAAIGEIDLLGEIRPTNMLDNRIKHAKRQGFKSVITSKDFRNLSSAVAKLLK